MIKGRIKITITIGEYINWTVVIEHNITQNKQEEHLKLNIKNIYRKAITTGNRSTFAEYFVDNNHTYNNIEDHMEILYKDTTRRNYECIGGVL